MCNVVWSFMPHLFICFFFVRSPTTDTVEEFFKCTSIKLMPYDEHDCMCVVPCVWLTQWFNLRKAWFVAVKICCFRHLFVVNCMFVYRFVAVVIIQVRSQAGPSYGSMRLQAQLKFGAPSYRKSKLLQFLAFKKICGHFSANNIQVKFCLQTATKEKIVRISEFLY